MYNDIEKIAKQVELPEKPKYGSIPDYIFFLVLIIVCIFCFSIQTGDALSQWIIRIIACIFCIMAVFILILVTRKYIKLKKEYSMAQEDELKYRRYKALQFILQNEKNVKETQMYMEWVKKHPKKNKVPHFIEMAILRGDSYTIQEYMNYITENREEFEEK